MQTEAIIQDLRGSLREAAVCGASRESGYSIQAQQVIHQLRKVVP
jgi:hypothetical protein